MRPIIGITAERERAQWVAMEADVDLLPANYADMVVAAGGCPVLVPLRAGYEANLAARLDGLIVSGGPDISPELYEAVPHSSMREMRPVRDEAELATLAAFIEAGRPILAICRGAQLLNVLQGGDLIQDLPEVLSGAHHRGSDGASIHHVVTLVPGSRAANALGATVQACCNHHQAISRLGCGLRVVARAADGVIEAVELDGHAFAIAVQWHPEESRDVRLFEALVAEAVDVRQTGRND